MVSEIFSKSISNAKQYLDADDFDQCDTIISNLKAFIHNSDVKQKYLEKEKKVMDEFNKRHKYAREQLKDNDPIMEFNKGIHEYMKLRSWRSIEMLSFIDELSREYDL